jgi:hypothetical protein
VKFSTGKKGTVLIQMGLEMNKFGRSTKRAGGLLHAFVYQFIEEVIEEVHLLKNLNKLIS